MKKLYYLLALCGLAIASCNPMSSTYKALDNNPKPGTLTYTLQPADYKLIPTSTDPAAGTALGLTDTAEANKDIPGILNIKFPGYANGSNANITYASPSTPIKIKLADSVYADTAVVYTLTTADYFLLPNNKYTDFSVAQLISWLPYKYGKPAQPTLKVLTWTTYPSNLNPPPPYSFLWLPTSGTWQQIYMLSNSQYASVGRGTYNQFTSSDDANIPAYINAILKADLSVSATAKTGDIKYISFNYYSSSKITSQRVIALSYNGTNWTTASVPVNNTSTFVKSGGSWAPDPTVYYTLTNADCILIANSTIGGDALATTRSSLGKYYDFEVGNGQFTPDLINQALILVLTNDFKTPKVNINYKVTYEAYTGKDVPTTVTFQYNGTTWVVQP